MKKIIFILFFSLSFFSCSHTRIINIKIPEEPKVLPVMVEDGSITGNSLDNVVENHIKIWTYVYQLRALLGEKNKK